MKVDPRILELCKAVTAKRPRTVIDHILKHGSITTEDLQQAYGYDHPPRAIADVREAGIPLQKFSVVSKRTNRTIAAYRFGDPAAIKAGRYLGRTAFSKKFKQAMIEKYGSKDAINGAELEARYLQIDHRIPYRIAGDGEHDQRDLGEFMLLDGSSQRAKSWSCENCRNWNDRDPEACRTCFWAFPERYEHVAMTKERRVDLIWRGEEVKHYESLLRLSEKTGVDLRTLLKKAALKLL